MYLNHKCAATELLWEPMMLLGRLDVLSWLESCTVLHWLTLDSDDFHFPMVYLREAMIIWVYFWCKEKTWYRSSYWSLHPRPTTFHLCSVGRFGFFPWVRCEDSRQVDPGSRGSHQMEKGADFLVRKWRGTSQEDASEPADCTRWWRTTARHVSSDGLWGSGGGAADPHLHCTSHHVYHM